MLEVKLLINYLLKSDQIESIKPTERIWMVLVLDIHKLIGKLPRPKAGWTPGKYKYMGAYNPLDKQLEYDKNTGEVTKWHVQPYNEVDRISAHHDICYDMGKNKNECDRSNGQVIR